MACFSNVCALLVPPGPGPSCALAHGHELDSPMQFQRAAALSIAAAALGVAPAWGATALSRAPYLQSLGKDRVTILWRTALPAVQTLECGWGGSFTKTVSDAA